MLQRLELVGFKSFAEKTRFEFAPGITAIVGPNGSGKSNVVDAVKWVLGEQSAKALRGGEMTDVIFNGSSTRRSVGLAEVSLTFDNSQQILASDALEVQITRRVYRDGEGEYLINGQSSRLKDVKDLFLGTGAGHGAYSVIEQGRVDALLMASTKDRRIIFEEAAGISRFKAKKLETLRKLDRVDADLVRVRDILQELEKQLRSARTQASKAQQHRELSEGLKRLRVGLAQREFAELTATLAREAELLQELRTAAALADADTAEGDANLLRLEKALRECDDERRSREGQLAEVKQSIFGLEATIKHERVQSTGIEIELHRLGKQRVETLERRRVLDAELVECESESRRSDAQVEDEKTLAETTAAALDEEAALIRELQGAAAIDRDTQVELSGRLARLQGDTERLRADIEGLSKDKQRIESEVERLREQLVASESGLTEIARAEKRLSNHLAGARQNREEYLAYREKLLEKANGVREELEGLRERRSALAGRADVLESLERGSEGLGAGVREVLRRRAEGDPLLNAALGGLVGDILRALSDVAPLVDLALGESAQSFVLLDASRSREVAASLADAPGRIGLIPGLAFPSDASPGRRLSEYVHADEPSMQGFAEQLLGNVVAVPDLAAAFEHAENSTGLRYITAAGEILEPDGRLSFGPINAETGIVSRKSELRDLRGQIAAYDERIAALEESSARIRRQIESLDAPLLALDTEIAALGGETASSREQLRERHRERQHLDESLFNLQRDLERIEAAQRQAAESLALESREAQEVESSLVQIAARLAQLNASLARVESNREAKRAEHLQAQLAYQRVRERQNAKRNQLAQLSEERDRRRGELQQFDAMELAGRSRLRASQLAILRATAASAEHCAAKEKASRELAIASTRHAALRNERDRWLAAFQRHRTTASERKDRAHAHEMIVRDLDHRRNAIAARMFDDYAIDAMALAQPADDEFDMDAEAAEEEIAELRRKLAKLGGVNTDSLGELESLETRERELRTQHDDLADSHRKLLDIIGQLNDDSRKVFVETLKEVRGHFQELFRKLFGGGQADIVLEENVDPLEAGIEVTARPPGKELRSISLLSGGERTLTAIALLLAIFRSKPSPFCLLDEVDAALDEANTARLASALGEFLDRSQFIIITHKKRTMAVADALYGITMQESGVSKQVSVRFEDWTEESEMPQKAAA